jgi:hypothetical protein
MAANTKTIRSDSPFSGFDMKKSLDGMMKVFSYDAIENTSSTKKASVKDVSVPGQAQRKSKQKQQGESNDE